MCDGWWSYFLILIVKLSLSNLDHSPSPSWFLQDTYSCPVFSVNLQVLQGQWTDVFYAAAFRWYWVGTLNLLKRSYWDISHSGVAALFFSFSSLQWTINHDSPLIFKVVFHTERCTFPLDSYLRHSFLPCSFSEEVRQKVLIGSWEFFEKNYIGEII